MKQQRDYLKRFDLRSDAMSWARMKARANCVPGWVWVVVDAAEGFLVVDLETGIRLGLGYEWVV